MTTDFKSPTFHLHFEGVGTLGHSVPAAALVQAVQALQRSIQLLAFAQEGQEVKQRLRTNYDMERKYAVVFDIPRDGGYDLPYKVGNAAAKLFDPDDVAKVTEQHQAVLAAIEAGDMQALKRAVPMPHIRRMVVNEIKKMQPPPRSGIVVSLEDYRNNKILDGRTSVERCNRILLDVAPISVHPRLVTGRLDSLDFQARILKLQLPTGRTLSCSYNEDFEPILLENPREWLQVRGEVVLNEDDSLKSLNNITEIIEVDPSPLEIESFEINGQIVKAIRPFVVAVNFDPVGGIYTATGIFNLIIGAETRDFLEESVIDALKFLWDEYALSDPVMFTADALDLRQNILTVFGADNVA